MSDLEVLGNPEADEGDLAAAQQRIADVRTDATERRARLVRQLEMADEFIGLLGARHG
jgi:MerR family copper efflux transcriptional regulator